MNLATFLSLSLYLTGILFSNGFLGPQLDCSQKATFLSSKLFGPEQYDDGIGESMSDSSQDGSALATDFYKQLNKRESEKQNDSQPTSSEQEDREFDYKQADPRKRIPLASSSPPALNQNPKVKFTGKDFTPSDASTRTSARFFSNSRATSAFGNGTPSRPGDQASNAPGRSPREVMMQQEYELVGRAERNIFIQAGIAVAALIFYVFIYLSGGIVTGDEATAGDFVGDDWIPYEEVMPVQRDSESSVWL